MRARRGRAGPLATGEAGSGSRPRNLGLIHTGCAGGPTGAGGPSIFSLGNAIQAVDEGNYGRLGAGRQQRYTDADAESMFAEPYTGGTPDEQPGALPEILPSPWEAGAADANIERCWSCRAMFMQAWGHLGSAWPVVHQQLGARPDAAAGGWRSSPSAPSRSPIGGRDIWPGRGAVDVYAARRGATYTTAVGTHGLRLRAPAIGHTLALGARR